MPITGAVDLVDALRELHLLEPAQLEKITRALQGKSPDPRTLARELVKHGWLTTFQANQLLQGRGAELVLGPYVLLERLGEGGMGQVFKARHQLMNRTVAIKVIRKELLAHGDAVERFHREIRLAAQLDHPHLVRAHDAAQVGDTHFLVMEYAEGSDLQSLVQKSGPLPVGQACNYVRQAALGLQHAAERGLVHRDIKPSNLQVTGQGTVLKVLDMGLARSQAADGQAPAAQLTQARTVLGTPDYMAPEQIVDPRQVDIRADIYSLGCAFYFMLAARPPFAEGSWEEKLVAHRKVEPQPIEQIRPDVPAALGAVLRKMMAKRPEDRYPTPAAVAEALAPFCGLTGPALTPAWPQATPFPGPALPGQATPAPLAGPPGGYPAGFTLRPDATVPPGPAPALPTQQNAAFAAPTVLVPGQQTAPQLPGQPVSGSPQPFDPAARKRFLRLVAGGGAGLLLLILLLILVWPKGSGGGGDKKGDNQEAKGTDSKGTAKPEGSPVFIQEDFRTTYGKRPLPEGWDGDAFRVVKIDDETCLEVGKVTLSGDKFSPPRKPSFVTLPPVKLSGNFYVEGAYLMKLGIYGARGTKGIQHLTIRLENRQSNAFLPVVIDQTGAVLFGDDARSAPPNYKAGSPTHFVLTRKGNLLSVMLNGEIVATKDLGEAADFDTLKLGLTEGDEEGSRTNFVGTCRLYRVKVGKLGADGAVPPSNAPLPKDPGGGPRRRKGK